MGDVAKNVGEFAHEEFWILELGILNVHYSKHVLKMSVFGMRILNLGFLSGRVQHIFMNFFSLCPETII